MADKPKIKIGHLKISDHLILGVANSNNSNGFQNFELQPTPIVGWNNIGDSLCSGDVDAAFVLAPYAMDLFKSGEKLKLILLGHKNGSTLIKNKKANIEKIEDFKGKSVIIPYQLSTHNMLFHKLLSDKGLEIGVGKDVVTEVMAPSQIPQAMEWDEDGEVGGFIVAEPFGSQVVKKGLGDELAMSKDIWPDHPCCVLVVRQDVIDSNADGVQELTEALVTAGKFIEDNSDEAARIGAEFLGQDVDVMKRVLTEPKDRVTFGSLKPVAEDLDKIQKYMSEQMTAVKGTIDVEKFIDPKFAEAAGAV